MTDLTSAIQAIPRGFKLCLFDKKVRRYAIKPWLIGIFAYLLSLSLAYYLHPVFITLLTSSYKSGIVYYLIWLAVSILLFIASSILSFIIVLISTALFQTEIAIEVLKDKYPNFKELSLVKETTRTVITESAKILWTVPIFIFVFILGLIPLLTPFAILFNSWLIAYQFCDVSLDLFKTKSKQRFKFAKKNFLFLSTIGASYMACWLIPFAGIFLTPVAIAGTTWALKESGLLEEFVN